MHLTSVLRQVIEGEREGNKLSQPEQLCPILLIHLRVLSFLDGERERKNSTSKQDGIFYDTRSLVLVRSASS